MSEGNELPEPESTFLSFDSGDSFESVLVTPIEPGVYRLEATPLCSEVVSLGDVIEAEKDDKGKLRFQRVISKSGLQVYRWLLSRRVVESDEFRIFCDRMMRVGGMWERALGGVVVVHVPEGSEIKPETEIERIISRSY